MVTLGKQHEHFPWPSVKWSRNYKATDTSLIKARAATLAWLTAVANSMLVSVSWRMFSFLSFCPHLVCHPQYLPCLCLTSPFTRTLRPDPALHTCCSPVESVCSNTPSTWKKWKLESPTVNSFFVVGGRSWAHSKEAIFFVKAEEWLGVREITFKKQEFLADICLIFEWCCCWAFYIFNTRY